MSLSEVVCLLEQPKTSMMGSVRIHIGLGSYFVKVIRFMNQIQNKV